MLISEEKLKNVLEQFDIHIRGVLHVGAHTCEELDVYKRMNIDPHNVIWVDANDMLTQSNKNRGIPNCYTAVLDEDESDKIFNVTNNFASSSLLDLGTHLNNYPHISVISKIPVRTEKLSTFINNNTIDISKYNLWNFDIQGSELHVLRGSSELLQYADCIYVEVNCEEVYKNCGLLEDLDSLLNSNGLTRVLTEISFANWGDAIYLRTSQN